MKSALKRFIPIFILFILFSSLLSSVAFAQTQNYQTNSYNASTNPDVPNNLHTYSQSVLIELMSAVVCQLAGVDPVNPHQECLGVDPTTNKIGFVQNGGGAIGLMGNAIGMLYTPPLHTSDYFAYLGNNFGIAKQSYAAKNAGNGFQSLSPLTNIWSAFRNVVYLLFVLIFVLIGFAIMLRLHIDPRTVMTVQNQIPKVIVGILLVTFSFAIAGFLIDMMYESIYLTTNLATQIDSNFKADTAAKILQSNNPFQAFDLATTGGNGSFGETLGGIKDIAWKPADAVGTAIAPVFDNPPGRVVVGTVMGIIGNVIGRGVVAIITPIATAIGGIIGAVGGALVPVGGETGATEVGGAVAGLKIGSMIGAFITGLTGASAVIGFLNPTNVAGAFISIVVWLVLAVAILFALFRVWFALISAYIFILLDVVFAPFWIAVGLFPGTQISFSLWIRDIIANLSAFPTVIVMFELGRIFIDVFGSTQATGQFVPPMIGNANSTNEIGAIIGLGILLLTPNAVAMTKGVLKAPKFDTAPIAAALGAGTGYVSAIHGHVGGTIMGSQEAYVRPGPGGAAVYQAKGPVRAFMGRFFR